MKCECGCGEEVSPGKRYIHGHYARVHNPMSDPKHRRKHLRIMKTKEEREKRSIANTGRIVKKSTRKKISVAMQGRDAYWMFGADNVMNRPEVKEKQKKNLVLAMTPKVIRKIKATLMDRYGVDNYSKTDEFKEFIRLENHPNWKGGITAEREAYYSRSEWKELSKYIWKRDKGTCQRCLVHQSDKVKSFNIHHIVDFEVTELRDDPDNLILLCRECHSFVHSKKNIHREFRSRLSRRKSA